MTPSDKQIRIEGRLPNERMGDWLIFIHHLHVSWLKARKSPWTADISKVYYPHPQQDKIVYYWRIIIQPNKGEEFGKLLPDIVNAIQTTPKSSRSDVMSIPLVGSRAGQPVGPDGKGAELSLKSVTGAARARTR